MPAKAEASKGFWITIGVLVAFAAVAIAYNFFGGAIGKK